MLQICTDFPSRRIGYRLMSYFWLRVVAACVEEVGKALAEHPPISFAAATTGPFNLVAAAITRGTNDLYRYLTDGVLGNYPASRPSRLHPPYVRSSASSDNRGSCEPPPGAARASPRPTPAHRRRAGSPPPDAKPACAALARARGAGVLAATGTPSLGGPACLVWLPMGAARRLSLGEFTLGGVTSHLARS